MVKPRLAGRLVRDRGVHEPVCAPDSSLDESLLVVILPPRSAVEECAVEAMGIDVMDEVGGRDRRVPRIESEDDRPASVSSRTRTVLGSSSDVFASSAASESLSAAALLRVLEAAFSGSLCEQAAASSGRMSRDAGKRIIGWK